MTWFPLPGSLLSVLIYPKNCEHGLDLVLACLDVLQTVYIYPLVSFQIVYDAEILDQFVWLDKIISDALFKK